MMSFFWKYGNELFILFLFPLIGLGLDFWISHRKTLYGLTASVVLFLPIFTGYAYIVSWLYQFFGLIALACLYSFYSRQISKRVAKIISSAIISALLFFILGWFSFMDSFAGYQETEESWRVDGYKIEYVRDQGFAGGPLLTYQLSKYTWIPVFVKKIETVRIDDLQESCNVPFKRSKLMFNPCDETLEPMP